jgi:hypothetical protein
VSVSFADTFGAGTFYQFSLDFKTVGDAGNSENGSAYGYGGVGYDYRIGKTEITGEQWLALERAISGTNYPTGTYLPRQALLIEAASYCNWLHNGATNVASTLYTGVYKIVDNAFVAWDPADQWVNTDGTKNPYRHKNAKYFLPNNDEFYKAGWYKGGGLNEGYWSYPTSTNVVPIAEGPSIGANSANYNGGTPLGVFPAGSYPNSVSPYGTLDQGGNAWELVDPADGTLSGGIVYPTLIGGGYPHGASPWLIGQPLPGAIGANDRYAWVGFRVAATQVSELSRGTQWVRDHDFTTMAAVGTSAYYSAGNFQSSVYENLGTTTFLPWSYIFDYAYQLLEKNEEVGLPWHLLVDVNDSFPHGLSDQVKADILRYISRFSGNDAFIVIDEPNRQQMDTLAAAQSWLRQMYPESLVYTNLTPEGQPDSRYYGTTPPSGGYSYSQYLDDYINIVNPDILMYDNYPFLASGSTNSTFFSNMAIIRGKALIANIPYWTWIQSWSDGVDYRVPSGSDLRMNVFSHLTYGYKGISYFTYNNLVGEAMINNDNTTRQLYIEAQNINAMLNNLGKTMKYLKSTNVRYIPGAGNSLPSGTTQWTAGAGGDTHITNISVNSTGTEHNALIGFFTDDVGQQYFMFTNLKHAAGLAPGSASLQFTITFDSTIDHILRLNSLTGETEVLMLTNHQYTWDLAGGTGDLFKYDTGRFYTGPLQADLNHDGMVNMPDFAEFARQWLLQE